MGWKDIRFSNIRLSHLSPGGVVEILHDLDVALASGEIIGLLGESGAGKSLLMRSLCALAAEGTGQAGLPFLPPGFILKGKISPQDRPPTLAMIFQDAKACLNPSLPVGRHLSEILRYCRPSAGFDTPQRLLKLVDLPGNREFLRRYPHELSGGMLQRLAIACAVAANPDILIADEALTALDSETAGQILNIFSGIARELRKTVLLVSHSLRIVESIVDRVIVMYSGHIIEERVRSGFFLNPRHPYSHALMESRPAQEHRGAALQEIPGEISPAGNRFPGCPFAPRCFRRQNDCLLTLPALSATDGGRHRCLHPMEDSSPRSFLPKGIGHDR